MTSRIGSPDTQADIDVRACLDSSPPRYFIMSWLLIQVNNISLKPQAVIPVNSRRAGQKISCITYTGVAVGEIAADVGNSQLFHISTIHSFLWSVIRPFRLRYRKVGRSANT